MRSFLIACLLLVFFVPVANADVRDSGDINTLIDEVATSWATQQNDKGLFINPLTGKTPGGYGQDMLAYTLLRSGERTGNAQVWHAGVDGLRAKQPKRVNGFTVWSAQAAYRHVGNLPTRDRDRLARYLSSVEALQVGERARQCFDKDTCYNNLKLLGSLATLSSLNSSLVSEIPSARLGDPSKALKDAMQTVNKRIPSVIDHGVKGSNDDEQRTGSILSDPSRNPIAYHALSSFMMTRTLIEADTLANDKARLATREALDALVLMVGPDGDLSYMGRGQEQVWVPAAIVSAGLEGATIFAKDRTRAAQYMGVAQLAFTRLQTYYRTGGALKLTPGPSRKDHAGMDDYADEITYNGLAAFILQYGADIAQQGLPDVAPVATPALKGNMQASDNNATGLAVSRRDDIWLAVHKQKTHPTDLRWDFGMLSMKAKGPMGWSNVLAPAPITTDRSDSAGPMLIADGIIARPYGYSASTSPDGRILVRGDYRTSTGRVLRHNVQWEYTPNSGVVVMTMKILPGDAFRTLIFAKTGQGKANSNKLITGPLDIEFSQVSSIKKTVGLSSAIFASQEQWMVESGPINAEQYTITYSVR